MRYLSVCSGMEAASVAWHPLGWQPVGFSEIEPFPCAILKHRFPNTPNYGDLTKYKEWPIEPGTVDLLVGGTPCQAFSVAGLRKGLADPRGNLSLVFLGLVQHLRPRWVLWENVPGVLSSGKPAGSDFASFLAGLGELGYGWAYRICDAQFYGVPQRRRRVFVVATSTGDWRVAAETLSLAEGMRGYLETRNETRKATARRAKGGSGADGLEGAGAVAQAFGGNNTSGPIEVAAALTAHGGPHGRMDFASETFIAQSFTASSFGQYQNGVGTLRANGGDLGGGSETLAVLPIHDQATRHSGKRGDKQDGKGNGLGIGQPGDPCPTLTRGDHHAVAIPYRKAKRAQSDKDDETWVEAQASNTLNNFDLGDTRTTHAIVENHPPMNNEPHIVQASELRLSGKITEQQVCPTLTAGAKSGDTEPLAVVHCSDVAPTVTSSGPPYSRTGNERVEAEALVAFQPGNLRRQAGADPSTETFPTLKCDSGDQSPHVANHPPMAVRRLTPVECERLQGFPDNWSRISWKGKPETECPDGPRYKACGNSMAVPVMRWIGERIAAVESSSHA